MKFNKDDIQTHYGQIVLFNYKT